LELPLTVNIGPPGSQGAAGLLTVPVTTYAAGPVIGPGSILQVNSPGVDTTLDDLDLSLFIDIVSLDGTNVLQLLYQGNIAQSGPGATGATVAPATVGSLTGTDLSYDPDTDTVTSAAGGEYGMLIQYYFAWD